MKNKSAIIYCCLIMLATISLIVVSAFYNTERVDTPKEYKEKIQQEYIAPQKKVSKPVVKKTTKAEREKLFKEINRLYKESIESERRAYHGNIGHI